jgi:dTDP-4-amino-4,6-dideoxygalactose transaminase
VGALNSGTAAVHLGLILLGVKAGDEVLCQSMTLSASSNPILYLGATPIFIDSEIQTWNLCPATLEEAIVDRIALKKNKSNYSGAFIRHAVQCRGDYGSSS